MNDNIRQLSSTSSGQRLQILLGSKPYEGTLREVEGYAKFPNQFDKIGELYTELLNDESLNEYVQQEINEHLVKIYWQFGGRQYEEQLTTLFQNLNEAVKPVHRKINSKLANNGVALHTRWEEGRGQIKLHPCAAHHHIASILGDAKSSFMLARVYFYAWGPDYHEQAIACAKKAIEQGDEKALVKLSEFCKQNMQAGNAEKIHKALEENVQVQVSLEPTLPSALEFSLKATSPSQSNKHSNKVEEGLPVQIIQLPIIQSTIDILPKEMADDHPDFELFEQVDEHLKKGWGMKAEVVLREIAHRNLHTNLNEQQINELFSTEAGITNTKDWYCDNGPTYTRIALKLAKCRWLLRDQLINFNFDTDDGDLLPSVTVKLLLEDKDTKVSELVKMVNPLESSEEKNAIALKRKHKIDELEHVVFSVGSSEENKAFKLELGEWYLTRRGMFGSVLDNEKEVAINFLTELNLKEIPDKYKNMKELNVSLSKTELSIDDRFFMMPF